VLFPHAVNLCIIFYLFKLKIAKDPISLSFPPAKSSMFPLFAVWQQHCLCSECCFLWGETLTTKHSSLLDFFS
jgi:hypothetical protein